LPPGRCVAGYFARAADRGPGRARGRGRRADVEGVVTAYTMRVSTALPFDAAVARMREALAEQGFGVLTEIDVQATLWEKPGVELPAQVTLGPCRPELAPQAMTAAPSIATLLPCNVAIRESTHGAVVEVIDPDAMSRLEAHSAIADVATEARARLRAALDR